ncbi:MAG TPA: hypothetical protein VGI46_14760 [Candidatus Acidoferrum sp.]
MRKLALCFLLYPAAVLAQSSTPAQDPATVQSAPQTQDTLRATAPAAAEIIEPGQAPAVVLLRPFSRTPAPAGNAPEFNLSAGYSVTNIAMPSSNGVALSGADVSLSARSGSRFGARLDIGYSRSMNVLRSGHGADVLSYFAGPVFFPWNGNLITTYVDALFGGAKVDGPFPDGAGGFRAGHVHYPAWTFGGGAEYRLSSSFAYRVSVDYLHTNFYNSSEAIRGQNDLRVVNSIVYYFGMPTARRRGSAH